jgi:D-alanine-D-alanine ligase
MLEYVRKAAHPNEVYFTKEPMLKAMVVEGGRRDSVAEGLRRAASLVGILEGAGMEAFLARPETSAELARRLSDDPPDIVFSGASHLPDAHGIRRNVHKTLEELGLPFVGSSSEVIELALSKEALKERWRNTGVRTPESFTVRTGDRDFNGKDIFGPILAYPCIVKPCREGDSRGISEQSVVSSLAELEERVAFVLSNYGDALVERFLGVEPDCREYTAALIGSPRSGSVLPISIGFVPGGKMKIVTHEDKASSATPVAPLRDADERRRVEGFARKAFVAAGVRDYARCDVIQAGGELYAIEINGQPMVPDSWFEACAATAGLGPESYPVAIVRAAVSRLREEGCGLPALGGGLS